MTLYGVYGASGFGREVMPIVREQVGVEDSRAKPSPELVFIDDGEVSREINGYRVMKWDEFVGTDASERLAVLAIANSRVRAQLAMRCVERNVGFLNVRERNVLSMDDVRIGEGALL